MPLGYVTAHWPIAARPRNSAPAAYESTPACGLVDESFGPARALRAVWTAYGQHPCCPQVPTLSGLSSTSPQALQGNYRKNDAITESHSECSTNAGTWVFN